MFAKTSAHLRTLISSLANRHDGTAVAVPSDGQSENQKSSSEVVCSSDGEYLHRFKVANHWERFRAETLSTKEAGTIAWIRESVGEGDVFVDVGANIGLYSMVAAMRVGKSGMVYAIEPHAANFTSLLSNIALNDLGSRIKPLSCALHFEEAILDFNYCDLLAGSSMSQLGSTSDAEEKEFVPVASEFKLATTLDRLVNSGPVRTPTHIKIDVDGNESFVLRGMAQILTSRERPRTVQVEINERYKGDLFEFMTAYGYEFVSRHDTALGKSRIEQGINPEEIAHNAIFRPKVSPV